ncbi:MAG: CoA-binding protein [Actinomycetota bacterium]|nr:CoA-binding protein [Actinomycetota bacterium]
MTTTSVPDASAGERLRILTTARSAALVGVSADPIKPSNFVAAYLVRTSMQVHLVNPAYDEVLGRKAYDSLADLPEVPDIVTIFRRPEAIPAVVDEAIEVGAKVVWMQLGLRHEEAARKAADAGLLVVQDRCLKIEHARFSGRLNLAGFDTGLISSKRHRPL